ncbi:hypothetical protein FRACA_10079 [Frankia canadensis]|uniref:Uncharacterized protein n=1 Tax=Frankia canadensis TaxID=1836972 RepID=A0A2I2KI17_9ACTN|nr:hypothetical protein FRACA_10079 [Frankia canadensis]SOU52610.1 hypothetical protein FRACA_10079 [Frankia canadensis]
MDGSARLLPASLGLGGGYTPPSPSTVPSASRRSLMDYRMTHVGRRRSHGTERGRGRSRR